MRKILKSKQIRIIKRLELLRLKTATKEVIDVQGTILIIVQKGDVQVRTRFGTVQNLAVNAYLRTTYRKNELQNVPSGTQHSTRAFCTIGATANEQERESGHYIVAQNALTDKSKEHGETRNSAKKWAHDN